MYTFRLNWHVNLATLLDHLNIYQRLIVVVFIGAKFSMFVYVFFFISSVFHSQSQSTKPTAISIFHIEPKIISLIWRMCDKKISNWEITKIYLNITSSLPLLLLLLRIKKEMKRGRKNLELGTHFKFIWTLKIYISHRNIPKYHTIPFAIPSDCRQRIAGIEIAQTSIVDKLI